jgi:hypothetical protein
MPAGTKPLSALGPTFTKMGEASQRAIVDGTKAATAAVERAVDLQGSRFHLRGRGGNSVRLGGTSDVRGFQTQNGSGVVRGRVRAFPEGMWHIVTYGSGPHIIASNTYKVARYRKLRSGRMKLETLGRKSQERRFFRGDSFGDVKPIRTPYGPRQFVVHPGHRGFGDPWFLAMTQSQQEVESAIRQQQFRDLVNVFVP